MFVSVCVCLETHRALLPGGGARRGRGTCVSYEEEEDTCTCVSYEEAEDTCASYEARARAMVSAEIAREHFTTLQSY